MRTINNTMAKSADTILAWLQRLGSERSYRWYASSIAIFKGRGLDSPELDWLESHLGAVNVGRYDSSAASVEKYIALAERAIKSGLLSKGLEQQARQQVADAKEFIKRFDDFLGHIQYDGAISMAAIAELIIIKAQQKCPVRTGELISSADWEAGETWFEVRFTSDHAWFAHEDCTNKGVGTAQHPIHHIEGYTGWSKTAGRYVSVPSTTYDCHGGGHFLSNAIQEVFPKLQLTGARYIQNDGSGGIIWHYDISMGGY